MNEKGWSKEYATTYVYGGGLTIHSTQDSKLQDKMEDVLVDNASTYQKKSQKTKAISQAAMAVIDNKTGYVVGVVGELGKKTTSRGLNRATQSVRQTGSSIKPIADLVPAIEEKLITPGTVYNDVATEFENNFKPKNQGKFLGYMSVREATSRSQNIPFVKIMAELKTEVARRYMKDMGISTLDDAHDVGLSLAIGGLYKGISPLEMSAAYATIANDGIYRTPLFYTKIVDSDGKIILEPEQETKEVFSKQTAYIVKDLLKSVISGVGATAPYCKISGMDVAVKTGTTNDDKDRWLCGFTNYYSGATWYGYDNPEEVFYSGNPAGFIWSKVMKKLHENKENSKFKEPDGIVRVKICSKTGLKATKKCSDTTYEICREDAIPEECNDASNSVKICEETGKIATEYCPNVITEYFGDSIPPKERLGLWPTSGNKTTKAPTEKCTLHTEENSGEEEAKLPIIKLKGNSTVTLTVGGTYIEKGATAKDEKDGDLTDKIQISGNVNTSKAGTYKVTYTVTNSANKTATVTRTVIVKDKKTPTTKPNTNTSTPSTNTTNTNTPNSNTINNNTTNTNTNTDENMENTTNITESNTSEDDEDDET